ncbi:hypothetical protein PVAP13_1KG201000 [Panicum virgatum]|uniref:Uncharacterized protein n=1 Tax=Panicum virgatum TaxID=38727 RepID=A0A8T0XEK4_PANVG|nr:hypothetical protein PVAP13_1KG201000 [Panicum virgatum]
MSKFSEYKKQAIRETGFGGLLDVPLINKVNLNLSSWLLSKLDTDESCILISEKRWIFVHEKDAGIVFGIPCGDLDVFSSEICPHQLTLTMMNCGLSPKEARSLKGIESVLEKHLDDRSTRLEEDNFKIAFVVYAIAHLLAPSAKHDHINI